MIVKALRILGKATTIISAAKTGYDIYQTSSTAFKAYKKVKVVKTGASSIMKEVGKVIKKGPR